LTVDKQHAVQILHCTIFARTKTGFNQGFKWVQS